MPSLISAGVSYRDMWEMCPAEINSVLEHIGERRREEQTLIASGAYSVGAFFHMRKMPDTVQQAFPELFGRTADGTIKAENWRESKRVLAEMRARAMKRGDGNGR